MAGGLIRANLLGLPSCGVKTLAGTSRGARGHLELVARRDAGQRGSSRLRCCAVRVSLIGLWKFPVSFAELCLPTGPQAAPMRAFGEVAARRAGDFRANSLKNCLITGVAAETGSLETQPTANKFNGLDREV